MMEQFELLAGTEAAIRLIWAVALLFFGLWLIIEFRGMVFPELIRWKPIMLRSFRVGFVLSLLLPIILTVMGSFAGPWGVLILFFGASYLPPSVYILSLALGGLFSVSLARRTLTPKEKKIAYTTIATLGTTGFAMLYISLVWLDKPI